MPQFPAGLDVIYPYDTTPFIRLSIEEVVVTLVEAIVLVVLIMYLFLQNLRATVIPTIAVPVVLLGTFGVLALAGFTINTLTMFGMVLAIGLLVDDAIVVIENVERVMAEEGLTPKEATRRSMTQITGALVGIAMVAVGGVPADGLLRRVDWRHLSAVLDHHRHGDGAVGDRRAGLHARAVRDAPETRPERPPRAKTRLLRVVQPHLRRRHPPLRGGRAADARTERPLPAGLRRHRRGGGPAVHPDPDRVPPR